MSDIWNRCDYCGRFIGLKEFDEGNARRFMSQPDNHFGPEKYMTYHVYCYDVAMDNIEKLLHKLNEREDYE